MVISYRTISKIMIIDFIVQIPSVLSNVIGTEVREQIHNQRRVHSYC